MVWLLREHGADHDYEQTLRIDFAKTARVSTFWSGLKKLAVTARKLSSVK